MKKRSPNANEALNEMLAQLQTNGNISLQQLLQSSMNLFMLAERQLHLDQNSEDKGNGFFNRQLGTPMGSLNLDVPRDRDGDFRPAILPKPKQRDIKERYDILEALLVNGYSTNVIADSLRDLNLHYNPEELDTLKNHLQAEHQQWLSRQLPQDVIGLFIDVYHAYARLDNTVQKVSLYVIVGIDFTGTKDLYGLYLDKGSESKGFWLQTLNHIIDRGLKRPLCIASDDFPGLKEAIATLFPQALHQLCVIHMQRNVRKNMAKDHASEFNETISLLRNYKDKDTAQSEFKQACERYQEYYPHFIKGLIADTDNYFAFLTLPKESQKYFYTTNIVESVNSMLEKMRQRMGGFFQSENALQLNVFLTIKKLKQRKWHKGMPMIKGNLYELRQCFARLYGELPQEE
jgi:transposase-like protein